MTDRPGRTFRFGVFLFSTNQLDLRRDGQSIRLQRQPAQVLALLLERAGQVVTRDELRHAVWGEDTFVDFDRGLNFCIAHIRTALGDDAANARYLRTIPKRGYEFICPVELLPPVANATDSREQPSTAPATARGWLPRFRPSRTAALAAAGLAMLAVAGGVIYARKAQSGPLIVAVARFDNETGEPALTRFSDYLTDSIVEQLTATGGARFEVVGNAAILRTARNQRDLGAIARTLHANYVVLGQVQRDSGRVRVLGHLIRLPDQTHVKVARVDDAALQTLAETSEIATRITQVLAPRVTASSPAPASR
ncbi:MAG TPA: winged helix-turn-helix domain-containing protein [Vicinamibacterales bacterium]|jgi:DNA-binding winged helix-turn-helix (wHTH) protein/TolB-like protein